MNKQLLFTKGYHLFLVLVVIGYIISIIIFNFFPTTPFAGILGFLSLLYYIATLIPGIFKIVFPKTKQSSVISWLFKNRRYLGIAAFCFALNHGTLLIGEKHLNVLRLHTYVDYFSGFFPLGVFTILAITSNNYSVKALKANWKKLHRLTYLVIFILPWHVLSKMHQHWNGITYCSIFSSIICIFLLIQKIRITTKFERQQNKVIKKKWKYVTNFKVLLTTFFLILFIKKTRMTTKNSKI